jgi:hypothetical protein
MSHQVQFRTWGVSLLSLQQLVHLVSLVKWRPISFLFHLHFIWLFSSFFPGKLCEQTGTNPVLFSRWSIGYGREMDCFFGYQRGGWSTGDILSFVLSRLIINPFVFPNVLNIDWSCTISLGSRLLRWAGNQRARRITSCNIPLSIRLIVFLYCYFAVHEFCAKCNYFVSNVSLFNF